MPHTRKNIKLQYLETKMFCNLCFRSFKGKTSFNLHAKVYHPNIKFSSSGKKIDNRVCARCRESFSSMKELNIHLNICKR